MVLELKRTGSVKPSNNCLLYGAAKSGKTRMLATAPNPIIISMDQGLVSIREMDLPFYEITCFAEYLEVEKMAKAGKFNGYTVGIDDLTELAEMFLLIAKPRNKNLMQAYGELNEEMMRIVRFWRGIETLTSVMICKQEKVKDESTGGLIYSAMIPGKAVAPMLPYLVGSVYHMEEYINPSTGVGTEVVRCKRNAQYEAGDRSGRLGELEFANFTHIFAKTMT